MDPCCYHMINITITPNSTTDNKLSTVQYILRLHHKIEKPMSPIYQVHQCSLPFLMR